MCVVCVFQTQDMLATLRLSQQETAKCRAVSFVPFDIILGIFSF